MTAKISAETVQRQLAGLLRKKALDIGRGACRLLQAGERTGILRERAWQPSSSRNRPVSPVPARRPERRARAR